MKSITTYITVLILTCLVGCKKLVDEKPLSEGTLDQFFKSVFDADASMGGMYGEFQQVMVGEGQFNNRYTFWGESRSDNFERFKTYTSPTTSELHFNNLTPNNNFADWSGLYRVIGRANLNLLKFPDINKYATPGSKDVISDATLKSYLAQCYALRAVCYFYILRIWGDAPIRTTPFLDLSDNAQQVREPKEKLLQQIIADLQKAYDMTAKGAQANVWYLNEGAICATMADVYMWRSHDNKIVPDYANAIKWMQLLFKAKSPTGKVYNSSATAAPGSGGALTDLEPTATWKNQFVNPAGSLEAIWNLHWDVSANGCPCMSGVSTAVNNTPHRISTEIFTGNWSKSTVDVRPKQTFDVTKKEQDRTWKWYPGSFGATGAAGKYTGTYGTDLNVYLPMYRLADQFLLYAEALNKTGDRANALKYLNLVHQRAGLPALTITTLNTEAAMEDAILQERQWELFGEGKRWFDLVRTDHVFQIMDPVLIARQSAEGAAPIGFGSDKTDRRKYVWPLHRDILNANPLLVQNPPYTD